MKLGFAADVNRRANRRATPAPETAARAFREKMTLTTGTWKATMRWMRRSLDKSEPTKWTSERERERERERASEFRYCGVRPSTISQSEWFLYSLRECSWFCLGFLDESEPEVEMPLRHLRIHPFCAPIFIVTPPYIHSIDLSFTPWSASAVIGR